MDIISTDDLRTEAIIHLFTSSFTASEGAAEGRLIGKLAGNLLSTVAEEDIVAFSAIEGEAPLGAIIFTRLTYEEDDRTVFLLSPVAVAPESQHKGVGQRLIQHGLKAIGQKGVDVVITYGDIRFYEKVGFRRIRVQEARPPFHLAYPEGWLGQALNDGSFAPLRGESRCVAAFNDPQYW